MPDSINQLIDDTMQAINRGCRPCLIAWLKRQPDRWGRSRILEDRIDHAALSGDQAGLEMALSDYRTFFAEMLSQFEVGESLPLFGGAAGQTSISFLHALGKAT